MHAVHLCRGWTLFEGMLDSYNQSYVTWCVRTKSPRDGTHTRDSSARCPSLPSVWGCSRRFSTSYYSNNCSGMQVYNQYQTHIMRDKGLQYIE